MLLLIFIGSLLIVCITPKAGPMLIKAVLQC